MATSAISACGYRRVLLNLCRLERISSVSSGKNVALRRQNIQFALFATKKNEDKQTEQTHSREHWPTSKFWKQADFSNKVLVQKPFVDFEEALQSLKSDKLITPRSFYYIMSLKDETVPWTENEAIEILSLLQSSRSGLTSDARLKWVHFMEERMKRQDSMSLKVYQAIMDCYLELNHPFDPVNILSEIEKRGLEPDHVWLELLIKRYVFMRDIESARSIYEHIGSQNPQTYSCKSVMLMGYTMLGMDEEAEEIINSFKGILDHKEMRLKYFYQPLLLGNALAGNVTRLKQLELELAEFGGRQSLIDVYLLNHIVTCSYHGTLQGAEFLIEFLGRCTSRFYNKVVPHLICLISNGHYDLAFKLFQQLQDPNGTIFFRAADRGEMPPEEVLKYSEIMQRNGCRNAHFDNYREILYRSKGKFDAIRQCFPLLKENGMEIRPNDFWQNICNIRDHGSKEDLQELLPFYSPDGVTENLFLFPCLKKFKVTSKQWLEYLTKAGYLNEDDCQYLQLNYAMFIGDVSTAREIIKAGISFDKLSASDEDLLFFTRTVVKKLSKKVDLKEFLKDSPAASEVPRHFGESQTFINFKDLLSKEGVQRRETIQVATDLVKSGRMADAISCLAKAKLERTETSADLPPFECSLFDVPVSERNLSFVKSYMEILIKRGYLVQGSPDNGKRMFEIKFSSEVIKSYLNFIFSSVDDDHLFTLLELSDKRRDLKTLLLYSWLSRLVKDSQTHRLKQVLVYLSNNKWHPDTITLCMALAFLENGQKDKAEMTLMKCGISSQTIIRSFNVLSGENKFKLMQELYILEAPRQSNPTVKTELLQIIRLCGEKTGFKEEGEEFYERHLQDIQVTKQEEAPSPPVTESLEMESEARGTPV